MTFPNLKPREEMMEKKPYTPPVVTQHGDAIKQTNGLGGKYWELYQPKSWSSLDPPKDD